MNAGKEMDSLVRRFIKDVGVSSDENTGRFFIEDQNGYPEDTFSDDHEGQFSALNSYIAELNKHNGVSASLGVDTEGHGFYMAVKYRDVEMTFPFHVAVEYDSPEEISKKFAAIVHVETASDKRYARDVQGSITASYVYFDHDDFTVDAVHHNSGQEPAAYDLRYTADRNELTNQIAFTISHEIRRVLNFERDAALLEKTKEHRVLPLQENNHS